MSENEEQLALINLNLSRGIGVDDNGYYYFE